MNENKMETRVNYNAKEKGGIKILSEGGFGFY